MPKQRARRQYRTGSITKRADGRWMGRFYAGFTASGNHRRIAVYGATEAEVKAKLLEAQRQYADKGAPTVSTRTTVKAWGEQWLEVTQRELRPKPWATDRSAVRKWIVPTIGHKRLEDLTAADVRAVQDAQRAKNLNTSSIRRNHLTLTTMLKAAVAEGHRIPDPPFNVKPPDLAPHDRDRMSVPETLAVLQVASYLPHGSRWAMAFLHGMRQGECLGLTWDCVNLDLGFVRVEWELQQVPYVDRSRPELGFRIPDKLAHRHLVDSYHLLPPKTKKGFRTFPLTAGMREALADWQKIAPENPWGLVWPTAGGRPANEKHDRLEWHALQGTAMVGHRSGRYYHPHEARHTSASELQELGVDDHTVTSFMGHSSILTSRGYQHPSERLGLTALEQLAARFQLETFKVQAPEIEA